MSNANPTEPNERTQADLHSPAPWFVVADHDPDHRHIQTSADVSAVCENIATAWGGGNVPVEANAKLIAAAPELLAASRAALAYDAAIHRRGFMGDVTSESGEREHYATGDDLDALYEDWIAKSRAAIAKAEGR